MLGRLRRLTGVETGQAAVTLVVVVVAVAVSAYLLLRTMNAAVNISKKAEIIKNTGRGIDAATDSILQLNKTNETAGSILNTAKPLEGQVDQIVQLAQSIDGLAASINGTAGTVNSTARGINATATDILGTARSINNGVATINQRVADTRGLANDIKAQTGVIVGYADQIHHDLASIAVAGPDGH